MNNELFCLDYFLKKFSGKWKPIILWLINHNINRFSLIQKQIPDLTKQMLSLQLKELETEKMITREAFAEIPPRVVYTITPYGKSILPIIQTMITWSQKELEKPIELTLF